MASAAQRDPAVAASFTAVSEPRKRWRLGPLEWICCIWLALVVICAAAAPLLPLPDPNQVAPLDRLQGPSAAHLLGTDGLGRDVLARLVYGSRVSLIVALCPAVIGLLLGGSIGLISGSRGGVVDHLSMLGMDVLLAFPPLVLVLALVTFGGSGIVTLVLAIGVLTIPYYARVARASTMSVHSRDFVTAATMRGARVPSVLVGEVLPNILPSLLAYGLVTMGVIVVLEGGLSFLGFGVRPPTPTWGGMIAEGQQFLQTAPALTLEPCMAIFFTVFAFNVLGDRARAVTQPEDG